VQCCATSSSVIMLCRLILSFILEGLNLEGGGSGGVFSDTWEWLTSVQADGYVVVVPKGGVALLYKFSGILSTMGGASSILDLTVLFLLSLTRRLFFTSFSLNLAPQLIQSLLLLGSSTIATMRGLSEELVSLLNV